MQHRESRISDSFFPRYATALALLTVASFSLTPAFVSAEEPMTIRYKDNIYTVTPDNTQILDEEDMESVIASTPSVCTPRTPCRYDDLPFGEEEFVASGGKWTNGLVTYSFVNTTPDLPSNRERGIIGQALGLWSNVAKVYPSEVTVAGGVCAGDIQIGWFSGNHGDGSSFDGPGGVLAHAFSPPPILAVV